MSSPNNQQRREPAEVELEKVSLEIEDLRWKVRRVNRAAQIFSIISACIAVFAFLMGLYQFNYQQQQEVKRPLRERQLALVFELSDVASKIAILKPDDTERKKAENRFRELYWGPIVFVEDQDLRKWVVDFNNCLDEYDRVQTLNQVIANDPESVGCASMAQQESRLKELSLNLAIKRRTTLGLDWDIAFEDIYKMRAKAPPTPFALP